MKIQEFSPRGLSYDGPMSTIFNSFYRLVLRSEKGYAYYLSQERIKNKNHTTIKSEPAIILQPRQSDPDNLTKIS
jgi:hypothetical protein